MSIVILSFLFFLVGFATIGLLSARKSKSTTNDYLLAGNSVKPWLVALSAVATNNSGYMFIGMIGYTYLYGLSSIWLMIGWIVGDFIASFIIHAKLRDVTEKHKCLSFSESLAKWQGKHAISVQWIAGFITVIFLGTYAGAQLKAGSKALHVLFGWDMSIGAIIGAILVVLYCFSGGIRASIWTDAAQSFVMIVAMALLLGTGIHAVGGLSETYQAWAGIADYLSLFPQQLPFGPIWGPLIFILGWLFAGYAVSGQPHIMVRYMTMDSSKHMARVRVYYYLWFIAFYVLTVGVGMVARLLVSTQGNFDAELALPTMAVTLLPGVLVGLVLAGLFAATMSTADSQILSCTAAITRDLLPHKKVSLSATKITTLLVALIALGIALLAPQNVFQLVLIAWSGLGSAFTPLITMLSFRKPVAEKTAIVMMLTGLLTVVIWRHVGFNAFIYEVFPGVVSGFGVYSVMSLLGFNKKTASAEV